MAQKREAVLSVEFNKLSPEEQNRVVDPATKRVDPEWITKALGYDPKNEKTLDYPKVEELNAQFQQLSPEDQNVILNGTKDERGYSVFVEFNEALSRDLKAEVALQGQNLTLQPAGQKNIPDSPKEKSPTLNELQNKLQQTILQQEETFIKTQNGKRGWNLLESAYGRRAGHTGSVFDGRVLTGNSSRIITRYNNSTKQWEIHNGERNSYGVRNKLVWEDPKTALTDGSLAGHGGQKMLIGFNKELDVIKKQIEEAQKKEQ